MVAHGLPGHNQVLFHYPNAYQSLPTLVCCGEDWTDDPDDYYLTSNYFSPDSQLTVLQITLEGAGRVNYNGQDFEVSTQQGFLLNSAMTPLLTYYYPYENKAPWRFVYLLMRGLQPFVSEFICRNGPVFSIDLQSEPVQMIQSILASPEDSFRFGLIENQHFINSLTETLLKNSEPTAESSWSDLIDRALIFIHANLNWPLVVEDVASHLKVCREYVSERFREELGISPAKYILREKMREACKYLHNTRLSITEVAHQLGYRNLSTFSRVFKQVTGDTPSKFRNRRRWL